MANTKKTFSITFTIPNFANLKEVTSPPEIHFGLKCYIKAELVSNSGHWLLRFRCNHRIGRKSNTNYLSFANVLIFFLNPSDNRIERESIEVDRFDNENRFNVQKYIELKKTVENHLVDGALTIRCDVTCLVRNCLSKAFDFSSSNLNSDVVLVAEGQEFHVSKTTLANVSPYFKTMFLEQTEPKITLANVNCHNLQLLLEIINQKTEITSNNAFEILELVQYFDMKDIEKHCVDVIFSSPEDQISMRNKIWIADEFKLPELLEKCFSKINYVSELQKACPREVEELSSNTKTWIIVKMLDSKLSPPDN